MTWAKFGTEYPAALLLAGLSDNAYRCHTDAIMWSYQMDGCLEIPGRLLPRITGCADPEAAAAELVRCKFWRPLPEGWRLVHYAAEIRESLAAQKAKRERDRNSQQAKRDRDKAEVRHLRAVAGDGKVVSDDVSDDVATESQTDRHTDRTDRTEVRLGGDLPDDFEPPF